MLWATFPIHVHPLLFFAVSANSHRGLLGCWVSELGGLHTETISVPEEKNALALSLGALGRFNPLAPSGTSPKSLEETDRTILGVTAVVLAHDWLDRLSSLVGVVEWDGRNVVMKNVSLDDAVKKVATDETKFTVNGSGSTTCESPGVAFVVRERRVGVLKEGDGDCAVC